MGVFTTSKAWQLGLNLTQQWWLSGASIDLDLDSNRYYDSSLAAGTQPLAILSNYLSITRASTGYAKTAAGTLTSFSSNQLRRTDLGLLVEDARTNLAQNSQDFTASSWIRDNGTVSGSLFTAPDGTTTANSFIENSSAGNHRIRVNTGFASASATGSVTGSWYIKNGATNGRRYVGLSLIANGSTTDFRQSIVVDTTNGAITATQTRNTPTNPRWSVEALANGWYRVIISFDVLITDTYEVNIFGCDSATPTFDSFAVATYTGDGVSNFYVWGAQEEQAAFPSSYIPTTGTSATRAADLVQASGTLNTILSALPHTDVIAGIVAGDQTAHAGAVWYFVGDDSGSNADLFLGANTDSQIGSRTGGVVIAANVGSGLFSTGFKAGVALASGARSLVANAGTVATDANATAMTSGHIGLGCQGNTNFMFGYLRRATFWNSKLADATLQALTAP